MQTFLAFLLFCGVLAHASVSWGPLMGFSHEGQNPVSVAWRVAFANLSYALILGYTAVYLLGGTGVLFRFAFFLGCAFCSVQAVRHFRRAQEG